MSRMHAEFRPRDSFAEPIGLRHLGIAGLAMLVGACVTSQVEELRQAETDMAAFESVVVLGRQHDSGLQAEETFTDCVGEALATGDTPLRVYPDEAFVDGLFPWFEPGTAPSKVEALAQLLRKPNVAEQIADSGVRYLVWIDGATQRMNDGGAFSCAAGPGGGGCLGFLWWENDSSYEASIWDLKHVQSAGLISAEASGSSYLPALIIPIPLIARTHAAACSGMAQQLKAFLTED